MRRNLLLAGVWLLGAVAAVGLSFAAVARVASGVAPAGVGSLSRRAIDNQLTSTSATTAARPPVSVPPVPTTARSTPTIAPPDVTIAPNTVTTSQGGTLWTRCSNQTTIVYVAAIPKSGYQRTVDVEDSAGISQQFENGNHRSNIQAACSSGRVRAEVDEESAGD